MTASRVVLPGYPHHVVQRGVRAIQLFGSDADRHLYLDLLHTSAQRYGCSFWAWCLMNNHVHLLAVPKSGNSLTRTMGESHRRYSRLVNKRESQRGHLFQGRFYSYAIRRDAHALAVARYIELNPVHAGIAQRPEAYEWSSARHNIRGSHDRLVESSPLREMVHDWEGFLRDRTEQLLTQFQIERRLRSGSPIM